jgi:hypothetical protein
MSTVFEKLVDRPYRHGFVTEVEVDALPKGLSQEIIRLIPDSSPSRRSCSIGGSRRTGIGSR